jgi:hypothetical protein
MPDLHLLNLVTGLAARIPPRRRQDGVGRNVYPGDAVHLAGPVSHLPTIL